MPTTVQTFYPSATEQDFTATGELDIKKLVETIGASNNTAQAAFGTAAASIVVDPYTPSSTTGTTNLPNYGWAINRLGTDGMDSTATAKRIIPAGTWTFNARLGASAVLTSAYRIEVSVYRVSSTGARTLLFGPINSATVSPNATGVDVSAATTQIKIVLQSNETLLVSYVINKTNTSLLAETVEFRLNDTIGNDVSVAVSSPGVRTDIFTTMPTVILRCLPLTVKKVKLTRTAIMRGLPTLIRRLTLFRSMTAIMRGLPVLNRVTTFRRVLSAVMRGIPARVVIKLKRTLAVIARGIPARVVIKLRRTLTAVMRGIPYVVRKITKRLTAIMRGIPTQNKVAVLARTLAVTMRGIPSRIILRVKKPMITAMRGIASLTKLPKKTLLVAMRGIPSIAKLLKKTLSTVAHIIPTQIKRATLRRVLFSQMRGQVRARIEMGFEVLSRIVGGGGTTIIKKVFNVYDDD